MSIMMIENPKHVVWRRWWMHVGINIKVFGIGTL